MDRARDGVTLIELMVVVAIVAILIGVAVPLAGSYVSRQQLQGAANTLVQDLRMAQNQAIVTRMYVAVTFDTAANSYSFERTAGGPTVTRAFNSALGFPSAILGSSFAGTSVYLTLTAKAPGGSQVPGFPGRAVLYFGPEGTPLTAANLSPSAAVEAGTDGNGPVIALVSRSGLQADVRVSPIIGLLSVEWK